MSDSVLAQLSLSAMLQTCSSSSISGSSISAAASSSSPRPSLIPFSVSSSSPTSSNTRSFFAAIPTASPSLSQRQRMLTPQRAVRAAAENDPTAVNRKPQTPAPRTPSTLKKAQAEGPFERPEVEASRLVAALAARGAQEARRAGDRRDRGRQWEEEQAMLHALQRLSAYHSAVLLPHSEAVCDFLAVTAGSLRSAQVLQSLRLLLQLLQSLPSASPPRLASAPLLAALTAACTKEAFLLDAALPCLRAALRLWPLRLLHHFAQPAQAASKNVQARQLSTCVLNTALAALCRLPLLPVADCAFCSSESCAAVSASCSSLSSLSAAELSQLLSQLQAAAEDGLAPTRRHSKQSVAAVFASLPAATVSAALKLLDYSEAEKVRRIAVASACSSSRPLPATPAQQQQHVTLPASLPSSTPSQPVLTPARAQAFATMPEAEERKAMADDVSWLGLGEEGLVSPITCPAGGLPEPKPDSGTQSGETRTDGGRLQAAQDDEAEDDGDQVVRVHAARTLTPIPLDLSSGSQEDDDKADEAETAAPAACTQPQLSHFEPAVISACDALHEQQSALVRPSLKRKRSSPPVPLSHPFASEPQLQPETQQEQALETTVPTSAAERLRHEASRVEEQMARGTRPTAEEMLRLIEMTNELRGQQTARSLHRAKEREAALMQLKAAAHSA